MVLMARNKVNDFDQWRRVFDSQAEAARAAQVPLVAFFAFRWLPQAPRQTLFIIALQASAALAAIVAAFFLTS